MHNKKCNCSIFSIYLSFLFACNHWEDWDIIWHAQLGSVGDSFKMIKFRITDFLLAISFLFVLTSWPTGIKF